MKTTIKHVMRAIWQRLGFFRRPVHRKLTRLVVEATRPQHETLLKELEVQRHLLMQLQAVVQQLLQQSSLNLSACQTLELNAESLIREVVRFQYQLDVQLAAMMELMETGMVKPPHLRAVA